MFKALMFPIIVLIPCLLILAAAVSHITSQLGEAIDNSYQYNCKQAGGKVVYPAKYVKDCVNENGKSIKL